MTMGMLADAIQKNITNKNVAKEPSCYKGVNAAEERKGDKQQKIEISRIIAFVNLGMAI